MHLEEQLREAGLDVERLHTRLIEFEHRTTEELREIEKDLDALRRRIAMLRVDALASVK